jgi:hypothetical protein
MFELTAFKGGRREPVANLAIRVLPITSTAYGRRTVALRHNWQVFDFVTAIATPNTTVDLAPDVNLDLSGRDALHVAPGVHINGGRSSGQLGARLFTTTKPGVLLVIGGYHNSDGVRVNGIRLDGGHMEIGDGNGPIGIRVRSSVNVDIGNNEIYGWTGIGVQVIDDRLERIASRNRSAVRVHDNFIHHNRHWGEQGYGVQANQSAYVLIERNVFDFNRHAIEASNTIGIGYMAYNNLLLTGGGETNPVWMSHQFDVHGSHTDWLNRGYYTGSAGEYFDYRYNSLFYVAGDVLKVRGRPDAGADVAHNVFGKDDPDEAIVQTDGDNLVAWKNRFGVVSSYRNDACDFDADGQPDAFLATGANWWFKGATAQFHFLRTSEEMFPLGTELTFGDVDHDGRCDVRATATQRVYSGGRDELLVSGLGGPPRPVATTRAHLAWTQGPRVRTWQLSPGLQSVASDVTVDYGSGVPSLLAADAAVIGTGDFNDDGATDLLFQDSAGRVDVMLLDEQGTLTDPGAPARRGSFRGEMLPTAARVAGIGDFNADGRSDVLWRRSDLRLEIWFAGEQGNSAKVSWLNSTGANGEPVDEPVTNPDWFVKGVGDFNGDGYSDIYWKHKDGGVSVWYMKHAMHVGEVYPGPVDPTWEVQGIADFDGDGRSDVLWRDGPGKLFLWFQGLPAGAAEPSWANQHGVTDPVWKVKALGDFDADGRADILWRHDNGLVAIWRMAGGKYLGESAPLPVDPAWQLGGTLPQGVQRLDMR